VDGNKRVSHAAMEVFLQLNGHELTCDVDQQEAFWLSLAAGDSSREQLTEWLLEHVRRAGESPA
jgi:death-on-curing protein